MNGIVEQGITKGVTETSFSPDLPCDRATVVTFLWRAAGKPAAKAEIGFTDVASGRFYTKAVAWAVEKGIAKGTTDTSFSPEQICNRGQAVTFLYREAKAK